MKKLVVISLFNGVGCAYVALERAGVNVALKISSEVDKYAIVSNKKNHPESIEVGDIRNIKVITDSDGKAVSLNTQQGTVSLLVHDVLLCGGSPCKDFSIAGKQKGMSTTCNVQLTSLEQYLKLKDEGFSFIGQSFLFWEFVRLLKEIKPAYFFLENVCMAEAWKKIISLAVGVNPIQINAALVSAQNRERLYWTNIGMEPCGLFRDMESIIQQPKDKLIFLCDVLQPDEEIAPKYYLSDTALARVTRKMGTEFSPCIDPIKTGTISTKNNSGQLRMDQGTTLISDRGAGGSIKINNTGKAEPLKSHNGCAWDQALKVDRYGVLNDRGVLQKTEKSTCIDANYTKGMDNHSQRTMVLSEQIVVHSTQTRTSTSGKGGTGPLSRCDGKTYALTQQVGSYIEKREIKQIGGNNLSNNGTQPYQQDRVYDSSGIAPALSWGKEDLIITTGRLPSGSLRRLTPIEVCRLQTLPDDYFFIDGKGIISDSRIYSCVGNGWCVDVIAHFFSYLPAEYKL